MPKEARVTLDGNEYVIPALNLGQLEDIAKVITATGAGTSGGLEILRIALRRATPKPDFETFAPTFTQIGDVVKSVLELSGLQEPDKNPPGPQPETPKV